MRPPAALMLLRGSAEGVMAWARKGLMPVHVVPGATWTLVAPADGRRAAAPYDDPVAVLGGRPVPPRLRPSLCLLAGAGRAVLVVQDTSRSAVQRWLVWTPGVGVARVDGLPPAPLALVADLVDPGGSRGDVVLDRLQQALRPDARAASDVVDDLLRALELPGAGVPLGAVAVADLPDAVRVEPHAHVVDRFDEFVATEPELSNEPDPREGRTP